MLPTAKPTTDPLGGHVSVLAGLDAGHHVRLRLVHQLVRQPLEPVGQRAGPAQLQLAAGRPPSRLRISSITWVTILMNSS